MTLGLLGLKISLLTLDSTCLLFLRYILFITLPSPYNLSRIKYSLLLTINNRKNVFSCLLLAFSEGCVEEYVLIG